MASNSKNPDIQIQDEEGIVDRKTKEHILNLRKQIDEDERELFVTKQTDSNVNLHHMEAVQYWSVTVKQYLRGIKRLWPRDGDSGVANVEYYWQEIQIGDGYTLVPPDKDGYEFSMIAHANVTPDDLRKVLELPRNVEIPEPETVTMNGLESILEKDMISHTWHVYTSKNGAPPNWDSITLTNEQPLPKGLLEDAVEVADDFLQQAGVGFDVSAADYMGGNEAGI